ncbi:MAG TPA: ATP-binding protein [Thermoleophilaceae bacterium]|jgi:anti-sigma regulatory factor (Ser/Thr protein kinase)
MAGVPGYSVLARESGYRGGGGFGDRDDDSGATIRLELDPGPAAASEARAALELLEGHADPNSLDDVRLLVSELVTNSVRHAGLSSGSKVALAASASDNTLRVEVSDEGPGFDPTPRSAARTDAGGWGLHLVDRIADRWGVDRRSAMAVWFEIDAEEAR